MSATLPNIDDSRHASTSRGLLVELLIDQQRLTAVDQFAHWHANHEVATVAERYRDLIPGKLPERGEQFAFEVDMDACSGCKACVTACHTLNGLEPDETWRNVGLLHGGTNQLPVLQHVTSACHHCLEPACLQGCPVEAYEKDPLTGIVRHLDDQCIGCQYCILKCPYDVPQYSPSKGIVRKCDMCSTRLAAGEAPACVQACPNGAIRITIVNRQQITEDSEANLFLPGVAEPSYTLPTTAYRTARVLPRNLLPADYFTARPQHAHWPLIVMLVLTQMSVGAFTMLMLLPHTAVPSANDSGAMRVAALGLGLLGLLASLFHLGRPQYAFRAFIGLRTSWLSREIIAFGLFAKLAALYAAVPLATFCGVDVSETVDRFCGLIVALTGILGVLCSAMIYVSTQRVYWQFVLTVPKFLLCSAVLGAPTALLVGIFADSISTNVSAAAVLAEWAPTVAVTTLVASVLKLSLEATTFAWLKSPLFSPLKRTATLLAGDLARFTTLRFVAGMSGGIVLPGLLWRSTVEADAANVGVATAIALATVMLTGLGELLERYLFFTAVVAPKMPGTPGA